MPRRSTKSQDLEAISIVNSGGLNLFEAENKINDNESPQMYNWFYRPNSKMPIVRPSIRCAVAVGEKFSTPIVKLHYYVKDATDQYLMCVSNDDLWYLDGSNEWQKVADLTAGSVPSMITFNGKLCVADGSGIYTWDGTTWATATTAIQPTVLFEHDNRVVANDSQSTGLDAVCFSAQEDETAWTFTSVGGAVLIRAGYKDGLKVNGFGSFGGNLLVSKTSQAAGGSYGMYRISTPGNPYDSTVLQWKSEPLPMNTGAEADHLFIMGDGVPYLHSKEGFRVIEGTDKFGDLISRSVGAKIRPLFGVGALQSMQMMAYIPKMACIMMFPEDTSEFYVYHPWNQAFTTLGMGSVEFKDAVQAGDDIYLAGDNGYIYKFGDDYQEYDLTDPSTSVLITSSLKTKNVAFGVEGLLKRTELFIEPITSGTLSLGVACSCESSPTEIASVTLTPSSLYDQDLYLFTDDLGGLSTNLTTHPEQDLFAAGNAAWVEPVYERYRERDLTFSVTTEGRCGLGEIRAQVALVGS